MYTVLARRIRWWISEKLDDLSTNQLVRKCIKIVLNKTEMSASKTRCKRQTSPSASMALHFALSGANMADYVKIRRTSSTKPTVGLYNVLHCRPEGTEPQPQATSTEIFVKFGFWDMQADRNTDRQTDMQIATFCPPAGNEVASILPIAHLVDKTACRASVVDVTRKLQHDVIRNI